MRNELKTTLGTQALIDLEDAAPDLLSETVAGSNTPLWPQVRTRFATAMAESELNSVVIPAKITKSKAYSRLIRSFIPSRFDAIRFRGPCDVLFVVGGTTVFSDGHVTRNWLIDEFASSTPGTIAIAQWRPQTGLPHAIERTRSLDLAEGRIDLAARVRPISPSASGDVMTLVDEFAGALGTELSIQRVQKIARAAQYQESRRPHLQREFGRMIDRLSPKVVVLQNASYGERAPLIADLKRRGIVVIEPQHGWIGPSHSAYNFGKAMSRPELQATLPDVLLTFGEYWSRSIRHPGRIVAVGKPYLNERVKSAPALGDRAKQALIVSSVADPETAAARVLLLRQNLPREWDVVFRVHPSERATARDRYAALVDQPGVHFDDNADVYESLARSRVVIGVASTVLYEAFAMGCRVVTLDSPATDYYVGETFGKAVATEDELVAAALEVVTEQRRTANAELSRADVWGENPATGFRDVISSYL